MGASADIASSVRSTASATLLESKKVLALKRVLTLVALPAATKAAPPNASGGAAAAALVAAAAVAALVAAALSGQHWTTSDRQSISEIRVALSAVTTSPPRRW
jgi:hypothetical protein